MKRVPWILFAALLGGCIDLELAHADCVDAGRCTIGEDAGGSDAGSDAGIDAGVMDAGNDAGVDAGVDASVDAGFDAGTPDAGPQDGGVDAGVDAGPPLCSGSTRPRMNCDPPINLGGGSAIDWTSLAPDPNGFLVAWVSNRVELKRVLFDGGVTSLVSRAGVASGQVTVDSKGARWALVWMSAGATSAACITSDSPDAAVLVSGNGGGLDVLSAALSVDGGVAIAAKRGPTFLGAQAHGCPTSISPLAFPIGPDGVAVVATSDPLADGFRYVYSGLGDAGSITDGNIIVGAISGSTLVTTGSYETQSHPLQSAATASSDGRNVLVVFDGEGPVLNQFQVSAYGTTADLVGTSDPSVLITDQRPGWWSISACGAGCAFAATTAFDIVAPAVLTFLSDDSSLSSKGAFDLACDVPSYVADNTSLSVAYSGGRIGALLTTSAGAKLYVCDVPPP